MDFKKLKLNVNKSFISGVVGTDTSDQNTREAKQDLLTTQALLKFYDELIKNIISKKNVDLNLLDERYRDAVDVPLLRKLKVAQVGIGGIGSPTLQALVGMGVQNIAVFDPDEVDIHNCGPQMHRILDIGKLKVDAAKEQMKCFRNIDLNTFNCKVDAYSNIVTNMGEEADILIGAVDNMIFRNKIAADLGFNESLHNFKDKFVRIDILDNFQNDVKVLDAVDAMWFDVVSEIQLTLQEFINLNISAIEKLFKLMRDQKVITLDTDVLLEENPDLFINEEWEAFSYLLAAINNFAILESCEFDKYPLYDPKNYKGIISFTHLIHSSLFIMNMMFQDTQRNHIPTLICLTDSTVTVFASRLLTRLSLFNPVTCVENLFIEELEENYFKIPETMSADDLENIELPGEYRYPYLYIDTRMSLGSWGAFALPIAFMQKRIRAYNSLVLRKCDPRLATFIYSDKLSRTELSQTIDSWYTVLDEMIVLSKLLSVYTLSGLFSPEEGIQEPCTARAIVYTGFNIASYIGALVHFASSNWNIFSEFKLISDDFNTFLQLGNKTKNKNKHFRWYRNFDSRTFTSIV